MSLEGVSGWSIRFEERCLLQVTKHSGYLSSKKTCESVTQVHDLTWNKRRLTICKVHEVAGLLYGLCQTILAEDFGMRHISVMWTATYLYGLCLAWMCTNQWKLLKKYNETLVYYYDAKTNSSHYSGNTLSCHNWKIFPRVQESESVVDCCIISMFHKVRLLANILVNMCRGYSMIQHVANHHKNWDLTICKRMTGTHCLLIPLMGQILSTCSIP
jgi:hypothetical protein